MTLLALLLQDTAAGTSPLLSLGIGGAIAGLVIEVARRDRKESQERYADLAKDFKSIVQDNTKAITALTAALPEQTATVDLLREVLRRGVGVNIEP